MKIPKYIDSLLKKRTYYACKLDTVSYALDKWLDKNEIHCKEYDTHTGCEIYCNPYDSERRVRNAILEKR